ncbi:TrkA family potassium uptake protein [Candidatus Chloroploca sp. Khr17]|uniref:potassium channel family protein n=1 Tax=Candidatus Chloroploca sp. Khr17 TaxID=2496869 RepID=UPI00101BA724|nr:potassium channel protein [Candidatus Chloroploca sp. Khr17]
MSTLNASEDEIRLERLRQRRRSYSLWRLLRANLYDLRMLLRQAWVPLASLVVLLLASALYLRLDYFPRLCVESGAFCGVDGDFATSLYATLLLLVFEAPTDFPNDLGGRLIFFGVPLFGLFFLLQSVVDFAQRLFDKGLRREGWQTALASTFSGHVIVCGIGRVGYRTVLQLLDVGYEVVAIDHDMGSEFAMTMSRLKVPLIVGDAREPEVLTQAGLTRAHSLIAAINDDLLNVEIALAARRKCPGLQTVMRIFNRQLDENLELTIGRNTAFSSSALAAPTLAAAAVSEAILHVFHLPGGPLALSEVTVADESGLTGFVGAIEQAYGVRVLRLRDAKRYERRCTFMTRIEGNDRILLLGSLDALERARRANRADSKLSFLSAQMQPVHNAPRANTVIVCGMGKVGSAIIRLLLQMKPRPNLVAICMPDTPRWQIEDLEAGGVRVLRGDAREAAVLEKAGIADAYAVAAVVGNDLVNLQIGMVARSLRPEVHLVLRVFSDVLAERLSGLFGINTVYSTSALAAPTLAAAAISREIDHAVDLGERIFASQAIVIDAGSSLGQRTIGAIREQDNLLVIALQHNGHLTQLPTPELLIVPGDEIMVLADLKALHRLHTDEKRKG